MNQAEIETALKAAFKECENALCPLSEEQKEIIRQKVLESYGYLPNSQENPLNQLTTAQRQALLTFIKTQQDQNLSWKATLLNDWLNNEDSGGVQFIRDQYGVAWLDQVQPIHVDQFLLQEKQKPLEVGDRIEICNGLWEWVQEDSPCPPEWFPCVVVGVSEVVDKDVRYTSCIVRFDTGVEFEIQGVYEWNQSYWRALK
ncbi:conserved hypothetical protein [Gloeothece citriformis PCC 7424]|uniref:Uncharacterized protein n=1 Tax=Gloeothece citriformis (strain PCC 7424) TaxID=65393 RepID=B7KE28_GLOC7|nr:hypothetical protein [Gloeothece citriformis]ACK71726.1 conserved hypothetical protein [Gloeothece citriformis PCC 7424]